jgi:microcompartment protein CcmL/EutN
VSGQGPTPRTGPALGLVEVASVARGMVVADAMVKRALVTLVQAHPVTPGKFVVVVGGGEEEVEQSMEVGLEVAADTVVDRLYLPKADPQLAPAMSGEVQISAAEVGSLGIVETFSVAASVLAADRSVKAAEVRLVQMRLARGLGGRGGGRAHHHSRWHAADHRDHRTASSGPGARDLRLASHQGINAESPPKKRSVPPSTGHRSAPRDAPRCAG